MNIGMITCNYFMRVYNYQEPEHFNWGEMSDKWRTEFHEADFLKLAGEIRDMGYNCLEIWEPTFSYKVYNLDTAKTLAAKLADMGFIQLAYCIGGWGAGDIGVVDAVYAFAQALGAKVVTGCITYPNIKPILDAIEAAGRKYSIRYAIENHPTPNLSSPYEVAEAMRDYETIGANLDTGIYNMEGHDVLKAMDILSGKIYHTHFKDTMRGGEGCLPIGDGDAPLAEVLRRLRDARFEGMVSVEFEYPKDPSPGLKKSMAFMKQALTAE